MSYFYRTLRMALKALAQNKMRTGLTMLGIIIGVGAVICVVAIGEGASASVERAITNIGANMIWVEAGGVNRGGVRTGKFGTKSLTLGDYEAIKEHVPLVTNVSPQVDTETQTVLAIWEVVGHLDILVNRGTVLEHVDEHGRHHFRPRVATATR